MVYIENAKYLVVIDTGSSASFINSEVVSELNLKLHKETHHVIARLMGGQVIQIQSFVFASIRKRNSSAKQHKFYVIENIPFAALLGTEFCKQNKLNIHFNENGANTVFDDESEDIFKEQFLQPNNWKGNEHERDHVYHEPSNTDAKDEVLNGHFEELYANLSMIREDLAFHSLTEMENMIQQNQKVEYPDTLDNYFIETENDMSQSPECAEKEPDITKIHIQSEDAYQRQLMEQLIEEFRYLFANNVHDLTRAVGVEHRIDIGDHKPVHQAPYRTSYKEKQVIKEQVQEMLERGIIRPSTSEFASPVVLVKKKDGKYRFCIDFRNLNKISRKDVFPLPRIDDTLHALNASLYYTCLDLFSGYWHIGIAEEDKHKTAFITPEGLYEFNVLCFGLCSAPATFQRYMNKVIGGLKWKSSLVYLDDIIIFSKTFEEHLVHVREVFERLSKYNLRLNPKKCEFLCQVVKFLGYVVSKSGISADPAKVQAVQRFPTPKNQKDLRSFLGLSGYYRSMIKSYAKIAVPMTKLLRKDCNGVRFQWNEEADKAFNKLKKRLTEAPILAHFICDLPLILYCDASTYAMGWVLHQLQDEHERVLVYGGKTFNNAQKKYCVTDLEACAVVTAVVKLRHFLVGVKFTIRVDHCSLCYIMKVKDASGRLLRWSLRLQEFDFAIEYKNGKQHLNADCMSRYPIEPSGEEVGEIPLYFTEIVRTQNTKDHRCRNKVNCLSQCELETITEPACSELNYLFEELNFMIDPDIIDNDQQEIEQKADQAKIHEVFNIQQLNMIEEQSKDPWCQFIMKELDKNSKRITGDYEFKNQILYKRSRNDNNEEILLMCLPKHLRQEVMQEIHAGITGGHGGFFKTWHKIRQRFFWPRLEKSVRKFVRSCTCCQFRKRDIGKPKGLLQPILTGKPFDLVGIDLMGPFPKTKDNKRWIVVAVDYATRYLITDSLTEAKSDDIAKFFIYKILCKHGAVRRILTDQGRQFISEAMEEVLKYFKTEHSKCTAYHARTSGLVERANRTIIDSISMYCNVNQRNWSKVLPLIEFAYNSAKNKSTKFSPFYAMFGYEATLPIDVTMDLPSQDDIKDISERWEDARYLIKEHIKQAQMVQKRYHDEKHRDVQFEVDDLVGLYTKVRKVGVSEKLLCKYTGPWKIIKKYEKPKDNYLLRDVQNKERVQRVSVTRLKRWHQREEEEPDLPLRKKNEELSSDAIENTSEIEVGILQEAEKAERDEKSQEKSRRFQPTIDSVNNPINKVDGVKMSSTSSTPVTGLTTPTLSLSGFGSNDGED